MKRILLTSLLLLFTVLVSAQEDKTQYITNPSFENGTNAWSVDGMAHQGNNSFTKKAGNYYMEKWTASGNSVGNGSVKQTLKNLPRGQYMLTVAAQNLSQNSTSKQNATVEFLSSAALRLVVCAKLVILLILTTLLPGVVV